MQVLINNGEKMKRRKITVDTDVT